MKVLAIVFGALLLSSQLFAQTVNVQYDEAADFAAYQTYTWKGCVIGDPDAVPSSITKLNIKRVRFAMSRQLMSKGLTEVEEGGDLNVACTGGRQDNRKVEGQASNYPIYAGYGAYDYYGWGPGWNSVRTVEWTEGLLVLDLVDAEREELAWRAFCSATASAAGSVSVATTRASGRSLAIASAMAPQPVPRSATSASVSSGSRARASCTSNSVSGRGTSVSGVTIRSSDQNSLRPVM